MNEAIYGDIALEKKLIKNFGVNMNVQKIIAETSPVASASWATVFLTSKKQLFVYIDSKTKLTLGDVKKIISRMGLKALDFHPPKNRSKYFEEIALDKFNLVFPGRVRVTSSDLHFYKTLVPYNPALVQIQEVKDGVIKCFDVDARTKWRPLVKFAYRRIRTS